MSDDDLARNIALLANQLAAREQLDFSLDSLTRLEALIAKQPIDTGTTTVWGGYLGETIRRQYPQHVRWVTYDSAAPTSTLLRGLERGPDLEAILAVGDRLWFPLSKVEKFQRNGAEDSLAAFASVVVGQIPREPTPEELAAERAHRDARDEHFMTVASRFRAAPSRETVWELEHALATGVQNKRHGELLRRLGLHADELLPFLAEPARGRGYARRDPGERSAALVAKLLYTGCAPRDELVAALRARLSDRSKDARKNAAYVLAYCDLRDGRSGVFVELANDRDRSIAMGAWHAMTHVTNDWRMEYLAPNLAIEPFVPLFTTALTANSPFVALALDALGSWIWEAPQRRDVAHFVKPLDALLDHTKPSIQNAAEDVLHRYLWSVVHDKPAQRPAHLKALQARRKRFVEPIDRILRPA